MKYTPPNFKETVGPELIQEENLSLWLDYRSEREREREREKGRERESKIQGRVNRDDKLNREGIHAIANEKII